MRQPGQCWIIFSSWCRRGETASFLDDTVLKSPEMALSHSAEQSSPPLLLYRIIGSPIKAFHPSFWEAAGAWAPWYFGQKCLFDVSGLCPLQQGFYSREKEERAKHSSRGWADWSTALGSLAKWPPPMVPWETCLPTASLQGAVRCKGAFISHMRPYTALFDCSGESSTILLYHWWLNADLSFHLDDM